MTEQMEVNIPLLRKMVEWVEYQEKLEPEVRNWRQVSWVTDEIYRTTVLSHAPGCGTAYCAAGYVAQLVDERFKDTDVVELNGKPDLYAADAAEKALGIVGKEHHMWYAGNKAGTIREEAERLAGEKL